MRILRTSGVSDFPAFLTHPGRHPDGHTGNRSNLCSSLSQNDQLSSCSYPFTIIIIIQFYVHKNE